MISHDFRESDHEQTWQVPPLEPGLRLSYDRDEYEKASGRDEPSQQGEVDR
jgi:hypothetical protein